MPVPNCKPMMLRDANLNATDNFAFSLQLKKNLKTGTVFLS